MIRKRQSRRGRRPAKSYAAPGSAEPAGRFFPHRSSGSHAGRRPSRSSSEGRSPGISAAPRIIFCCVLRCSAQRAKSSPDCPSREDLTNGTRGLKMNSWPVGPNVTGNKKVLGGRCTRASPFAGGTDAPSGLASATRGTLTRSASEGRCPDPRLCFGLVSRHPACRYKYGWPPTPFTYRLRDVPHDRTRKYEINFHVQIPHHPCSGLGGVGLKFAGGRSAGPSLPESRENPQGIDHVRPRLSWTIRFRPARRPANGLPGARRFVVRRLRGTKEIAGIPARSPPINPSTSITPAGR